MRIFIVLTIDLMMLWISAFAAYSGFLPRFSIPEITRFRNLICSVAFRFDPFSMILCDMPSTRAEISCHVFPVVAVIPDDVVVVTTAPVIVTIVFDPVAVPVEMAAEATGIQYCEFVLYV